MASEILKVFQEQIEPALVGIEQERKKVARFFLITLLVYIGLFIGILTLPDLIANILNVEFENVLLVLVILFGALAVFMFIVSYIKRKKYIKEFKSKVVAKLVKATDPHWNYDAELGIDENVYSNSGIFTTPHNRYHSEDRVAGKVGVVNFQCAEIKTFYVYYTGFGKNRRRHKVKVFDGLFLHADFNKEFEGKVIVRPDTAEKFFGRLGEKFQKIGRGDTFVKMEDVDFEREFVVYASDQIEARYILTPAIMSAMLDIKQTFGSRVGFSFVDSQVNYAISIPGNLFEPRIFRSHNFDDAKRMCRFFYSIIQVINALDLNTRIWTKK